MKKYVFKTTVLLLLVVVVIYACKRTVQAEENANTNFNAAAAKEWYYGVFKKSSQWEKGKVTTGIKLPDWKNFKEYKIGDISVVEFPLLQERKIRRFTEDNISNEERNKMFNATLDKILFFKMPNGNIKIRAVQITPALDYLKSKNYDIANNSFISLDANYSGTLQMFKWDGSFVKGYTYKDGKSINAIKKISKTQPNSHQVNTRTSDEGDVICDYHIDYYYIQTCYTTIYNDGMVTEECDEPILDHIEYYEYNCHEDPCFGENFTAECFCENYGLCANNDDESEEGEDACAKCDREFNNFVNSGHAVSEDAGYTLEEISAFRKYKNPSWFCYKGLTWAIRSKEKGIVELTNAATKEWRWISLEHSGTSVVGFLGLGNVDVQNEIGTPSFVEGTPNVLYAAISLDFELKFSPICNGCPFPTPPVTKSVVGVHSTFWNAKP